MVFSNKFLSYRAGIAFLFVMVLLVGLVRWPHAGLCNGGWLILNSANKEGIRYESAIPWFRAAAGQEPASESSWRGLGWALAGSGQETAARQEWTHLPDDDSLFMQYAQVSLFSQEYEAALRWLMRAQAAQPELADAWYYAGTVYEIIHEQKAALKAYQTAVNASQHQQIGLADVQTRLGRLWQSSGKGEAALAAYRSAAQADDFAVPFNRVLMLTGLGQAVAMRGDYAEAIGYFEAAMAFDPTYGWAYFRLGQAYGLCCADWEKGAEIIQNGLVYDSENAWGYVFLGDAYAANGDVAQAQTAYIQALQLSPNWREAEERLAVLNEQK